MYIRTYLYYVYELSLFFYLIYFSLFYFILLYLIFFFSFLFLFFYSVFPLFGKKTITSILASVLDFCQVSHRLAQAQPAPQKSHCP